MVYSLYRKYVIRTLAFSNSQADVGIGYDVVDGFDKRRSLVSWRDVRDENSVVDVDEDQSEQTPRPNHKSNKCRFARNVTTCRHSVISYVNSFIKPEPNFTLTQKCWNDVHVDLISHSVHTNWIQQWIHFLVVISSGLISHFYNLIEENYCDNDGYWSQQ